MPVAVATYTSISIMIRAEQKTKPGPTPVNAAISAPKNEIPVIVLIFSGVASRSPGVNL